MQELTGKMRAAADRYEMLAGHDRIAVGVSGGKDSMALLRGLNDLRRYYPHRFELVALTADPCFGGNETDYTPIEAFCREQNIPYVLRRTEVGKIVFEDRRETNPCSLCAKMRRGILHTMAKEQDCTALALGHHMDDAVQTFFMNLLYGGRLGCFSPKSYLSRRALWLIRPLVFCTEKEITQAARREKLPVVKSRCPADGVTSRQNTADWMAQLEGKFPDLKAKILGAMQRGDLDGWGF